MKKNCFLIAKRKCKSVSLRTAMHIFSATRNPGSTVLPVELNIIAILFEKFGKVQETKLLILRI
jgi:hypothetical protein